MNAETPKDGEKTPEKKKKTKRKKAAKKTKAAKKKATKKKSSATASRAPWTFPKNTLEDALRIPRAIEDKNAGNPMHASVLVKAVGYSKTNDWRFLDLLKSANQYGLVEGSGQTALVTLAQTGEDVVVPSTTTQRQEALMQAFRNVEEFQDVEAFYGGKKIPEDEFFENTVVRQFGIPRDRVKTFVDVFLANLRYLKMFNAQSQTTTPPEPTSDAPSPATESTERVREFLDTCFVMMPFGDWMDKYYKEIYVPAIKEAGFEPVRADELFSTGTVVEQIWNEIEKSTVLLADLTGKNANVFYELGLAHAAQKPVVFTAGSIDDVPFDLRHLRVIVYDTRAPRWADNLAKSVTDYLKNAKADPTKSIPQPFRQLAIANQNAE